MKKREGGSYNYRCNCELFVCKWYDRSNVNITRNHVTHEPACKVRAHVKRKGKIEVTHLNMTYKYNKEMGMCGSNGLTSRILQTNGRREREREKEVVATVGKSDEYIHCRTLDFIVFFTEKIEKRWYTLSSHEKLLCLRWDLLKMTTITRS